MRKLLSTELSPVWALLPIYLAGYFTYAFNLEPMWLYWSVTTYGDRTNLGPAWTEKYEQLIRDAMSKENSANNKTAKHVSIDLRL